MGKPKEQIMGLTKLRLKTESREEYTPSDQEIMDYFQKNMHDVFLQFIWDLDKKDIMGFREMCSMKEINDFVDKWIKTNFKRPS